MECDLVLVGGGPGATCVLSALASWVGRAPGGGPRRVAVVERTACLGPGLPYGEAADPAHTYGRTRRRRRDKGRALQHQAHQALQALGEHGVEVVVWTDTCAHALARRDGAWCVATDRGELQADHTVLATGPWHTHALRGIERAVDWRWDVRRLHAMVRDDEDVLVLGTSQSAVDLCLTLGARRRRSTVARPGAITLASRRGLLPSVWGPLRGSRVPPGEAREIEALRGVPGVRLGDVYAALRRDLERLGARCCEDLEGAPFSEVAREGLGTLREDVTTAQRARRRGEELPWQAVLWPTVPAVFELFPRLPAEDRLALAPRWSQWLRYLEAIHADAARGVLALADAGMVRVVALGPSVTVTEDARGVYARGALGEARGARVVDARGQDPRALLGDDPFLRSAFAGGWVTAARTPFLGPAPSTVPPPFALLREGAQEHLVTGGVWVEPETFLARDPSGDTSGLYALGPLTQGQYPVYLGLWALRVAAERLVRHLATSPQRASPTAFTASPTTRRG